MKRIGHLCAFLAAAAALAGGSARAEADWFTRVHADEGLEVRADARVFALFAVLNGLGYDEAPLRRQHPVAARDFHPVRQRVRQAVRLPDDLRQRFQSFFDAHPVPAAEYARYVATLGEPPGFERTARTPSTLVGLEPLLSEAWRVLELGPLFQAVYPEYRNALRGYLAVAVGPVGALERLLSRAGEQGGRSLVLMPNVLDGAGAGAVAIGEVAEGTALLCGPEDAEAGVAVAAAVARARLELRLASSPLVRSAPPGAKQAGGGVAWAAEVLARALTSAALHLPASRVDAWSAGVYWPVRAVAKAVSGSSAQPAVAVAEAALARELGKRGGVH